MQLDISLINNQLDDALREDCGLRGDITTKAIIPDNKHINFNILTREDIILAGVPIVEYFLSKYSTVKFESKAKDGKKLYAKDLIIRGSGRAHDILMLERVMLNYLQHMSGIATMTAKYVEKTHGTKAKIYDTRKTIPGLRMLQKYAVRCGGGYNHRLALDSAIMIKDNHIASSRSIKEAIRLAKLHNSHYAKIEIECDTISQVVESLECGAEIILLDNMSIEDLKHAVELIGDKAIIEASGGINLDNIDLVAKAGVDVISVGALTHSVRSSDIGLDIIA